MSESECICPVVEIKVTSRDHVSEREMRQIADDLNASVSLIAPDERHALFGLHRLDCPCTPFTSKGRW